MKIAIIGTGNVGRTLGGRWAKSGHEIIFGARDPRGTKVQQVLASAGANAHAATVREAAAAAPVVVLATPWAATQDVVKSAGNLQGKILVDCTNPIKEGLAGLSVGLTTSAAEQIASWVPGAQVVKAFSTTGTKNMANPLYGSEKITMFICGDDADAKKTVAGLASELGFDVVDTGALLTARYLEPLAMLWVHMAYAAGFGPDIAFKVLKR